MANIQRGARAGAAAVALGLSLAWPTIAIASADTPDGDSSSVSAGPAKTPGTGHSARTAKPTQGSASSKKSSSARKPTSAARVQVSTPDATTTDATADKPKAQSSRTVSDATSSSTAEADTSGSAQTTDSQQTAATTTSTPKVAEASATPTAATTTSTITALRVPSASASPTDVITGFFGSIQGLFEGAALLVRRTFFNEAPTVTPVQLTGETTGPITGKVGAVDPEGDKMVYKVAQQGHYGTVTVDANGNYTYTPDDPGANIVDSFVVSATDTGPHINLLNWFRTPSTYAAGSIYQEPANTPRITYVFTYGNGSQFWSSAARAELAATAIYLSSYFEPQHDVTITYAVTGQYSLAGSTLASAGSDLISDQGFAETVVQHKILTGEDLNGSAADGTIDWNFGYGWGYFSTVPAGSYDFQSTAMHELLHTYGFLSVIDSAGNNSIENWTTFDKFVVDKYGNSVWTGPNDTTFNSTAYNSNLTGGNGGLYFGGPTLPTTYAYQANQNNPVPLYTPNPWESGSSMSHLNDNYYNGSSDLRPEMLMNAASDTGPGVTKLSDIEIGIMADLGYKMVGLSNATMVSASPTVAVLFIGLMLVRRRKTAKSA